MGLNADKTLMQTLTNQGVGSASGSWFDLSGYSAGAFYVVVTAGTGAITPAFDVSPDNGTTVLTGAIVAAEMAAPTAQTGVGAKRYPFLLPMAVPWVRVTSTVATAPVTANVYFMGRR